MENMFEEIPADDYSETKQHFKLVCESHKKSVCGQCCTDFSLLNQLRYDDKYLVASNESKRKARIQSALDKYYTSPAVVENLSSTRTSSPHLQGLLIRAQTGAVSPGELATLVSYVCYASRLVPAGRKKLLELMHTTLENMPNMDRTRIVAQLEQAKREQKREAKQTKARRKGSKVKDRHAKLESIQKDMGSSVQEMLLLVTRAQVDSLGDFFTEFNSVTKGMNASGSIESVFAAMDITGNNVNLGSDALATMESHAKWLELVLKHSGHGVPMDDPADWSRDRLLDFLHQHGVNPTPLPSQTVLQDLARQLVKFCMACMEIINDMPDDDEAAALGRQSMGIADETDLAKIAKMNGPATRMEFILDSQIPSEFKLASSTKNWPVSSSPSTETVFRMARVMHKDKFPLATPQDKLYYEILNSIEAFAFVYDKLKEEPDQDRLVTFDVGKDTPDEQTMSVRVLGALQLGEFESPMGTLPLPLLVVEFYHCRRVESNVKKMQAYGAGLRKGTLFQGLNSTVEETELMLELLRENRHQLIQDDDLYKHFEEQVNKGWKLSVIRPCDPDKKGGARVCPPCGKIATKLCGRCEVTAYCCVECQHLDWKIHKKACRKKEGAAK